MTVTAPKPKSRAEWITDLLHEGYQVVDSSSHEIPQWLRDLNPDIIALREDKQLIVEFRNSQKVKTPGYLHRISETTKKYPSWHLWIASEEKNIVDELISLSEIKDNLEKSAKEFSEGNLEISFLHSWSCTEAIMRWILIQNNIKPYLDTTRQIISAIHSDGYMEKADYLLLTKSLDIRNRFVHGMRTEIRPQDASELISCAYRLLAELEDSSQE